MLEHFLSYLTQEHLTELFQSYRAFGPLIAVLLPLIEAFLPFLPLIVFVVANTNSFGLWEGFILSWAGSTAGSILVFLIVRQYGQRKLLGFIRSHPSVRKLMLWVERHGFGPMFLLLCFPMKGECQYALSETSVAASCHWIVYEFVCSHFYCLSSNRWIVF